MTRAKWLKIWACVIAFLCLMSLFVVFTMGIIVNQIQGSPISTHGLIAIGVGSFFTFLTAGVLMGLLFFSARSGHDDDINSYEE